MTTSLAADRVEIAAAVNTVTGVTCTPGYRTLTKQGDALVRLDNLTRDLSGFGFIATWQVLVALHQDLPKAEAWTDANTEALIVAAAAALVVTDVAPVELVMDQGKIPALQLTGTRAI
jgi:hypothetical protein